MHLASARFWALYELLPAEIQATADKNYVLPKADPCHPSLHFKKVGPLWSARVRDLYRVPGRDVEDGILWFWIGTHAE
jgi:hypothetical protein